MSKIAKSNMKRVCFFCSQNISFGEMTEEHVIPNSLLKKLGVKEQTLNGGGHFLYSRLKVPAHQRCNNEFGSRYEKKVLHLLESPEKLFAEVFFKESFDLISTPSVDPVSLISTWLLKIYYGLFYHNYLKSDNKEWVDLCEGVVGSDEFRRVQESYQNGYAFSSPSSLFIFKTKEEGFDLITHLAPATILLKIKNLVFVLCVGDGQLSKTFFDNHLAQNRLLEEEKKNPYSPYRSIYAEIVAMRVCSKKSPQYLMMGEGFFLNMSFFTGVRDPELFFRLNKNDLIQNKQDILKSATERSVKKINKKSG